MDVLRIPRELAAKVVALITGHALARDIADELKDQGAIAAIVGAARRDVLAKEQARAETDRQKKAERTLNTPERRELLNRAARLASQAGIPLAEAEEFLTQKED